MTKTEVVSFTEAIRQATEHCVKIDPTVIVMGLGVSYKNGADGTMGTLKSEYPNQIFDTPVSEFCNTGAGVGAAVTGLRPIIHHARVEFGLFGADQIVTQAAKWNYMFGGDNPVPIVFRLAVGRQWGNGPQHTQALYSLFGNVPGLRVVVPSTPYMAKGLLISAVKSNDPVVFMEPRWLYGVKQSIPIEPYEVSLSKSVYLNKGSDVTIVAYGDGAAEALKSLAMLKDKGICPDIVDLVSLNPIDYSLIEESLKRTGKLVVIDTTNKEFSVGNQILGHVTSQFSGLLSSVPVHVSCPSCPCPTSTSLTENFYPTSHDIAEAVLTVSKPILDRNSKDRFSSVKISSFEELHHSPKYTMSLVQ